MIAVLILALAGSYPAAAHCCSLGSGGSYNFLGDPAVDISMDSYDEFVRESLPAYHVAVPDVKRAATSRLSLNLSDNRRLEILLSRADASFTGRGNMTTANETGPVNAVGMLQGSQLSLNVTALGRQIYKFSLVGEGSFLPSFTSLWFSFLGKISS